VNARLRVDPAFEILPVRPPVASGRPPRSWDEVQTIVPFRMRAEAPDGRFRPLAAAQMQQVYLRAATAAPASGRPRLEVGQPVRCGAGAALRLCSSARMVADVHEHGSPERLVGWVTAALDALAGLGTEVARLDA
jgi:hypothetical protein